MTTRAPWRSGGGAADAERVPAGSGGTRAVGRRAGGTQRHARGSRGRLPNSSHTLSVCSRPHAFPFFVFRPETLLLTFRFVWRRGRAPNIHCPFKQKYWKKAKQTNLMNSRCEKALHLGIGLCVVGLHDYAKNYNPDKCAQYCDHNYLSWLFIHLGEGNYLSAFFKYRENCRHNSTVFWKPKNKYTQCQNLWIKTELIVHFQSL